MPQFMDFFALEKHVWKIYAGIAATAMKWSKSSAAVPTATWSEQLAAAATPTLKIFWRLRRPVKTIPSLFDLDLAVKGRPQCNLEFC